MNTRLRLGISLRIAVRASRTSVIQRPPSFGGLVSAAGWLPQSTDSATAFKTRMTTNTAAKESPKSFP